MSRVWWHVIRFGARLCVWAYYSAFRVENAKRIPKTGPVLFVVNHPNALVDACAVLRAVPRPVSFAAKHTLFTMPVVGWLLRKLGAVPVYRTADRSGRARDNLNMFSAFTQHFQRGGAAVIFPEGLSHLDPELRQVKSGPARIALGAEAEADFGLGLEIVPIGLHYEPEERFRGEVHVRIGEPFGVADLRDVHRRDAIRTVQERIAASLRPLMLHLDDVELGPLVSGIANVYVENPRAQPAGMKPRPRSEVVQIAGACLNYFLVADPGAVQLAGKKLRRYERLSKLTGVGGPALESRARPWRAWLGALRLAVGLVVGFPIFVLGCLVGYVPYRATERVARHFSRREGRVSIPTLRIFWGALIFLFFWGALTLFVFLWSRSPGFTAFFSAGLVVTSFYARFYAGRVLTWRKRLAGMVPRLRPGIDRVARARDELLQLVNELARRYETESGAGLLTPRKQKWYQRVPWRTGAVLLLLSLMGWFAWGLRDVEVAELPDRPSPWVGLDGPHAHATLERDAGALIGLLDTLDELEKRMRVLKSDFEAERREDTNVADVQLVRSALGTYLRCRKALFRLVWFYRAPDRAGEQEQSERAFLLGYVAALDLVQRGMQLLAAFEDSSRSVRKLNEGDRASGLAPGAFDRVRRNLANAESFAELAAAKTRWDTLEAGPRPTQPLWSRIWNEAEARRDVVGELGRKQRGFKWKSAEARAVHAVEKARYATSRFFAVQIGNVHIREGELASGLINDRQVEWLRGMLRPGDILLQRHNWALSNAFLPGFWTHAALYVGGADGVRELGIEADEGVRPHLAALARPDGHGDPHVIIEAQGEGVIFSTLEESVGGSDAVCVLRPRLSKPQIAAAVARAISQYGKPYDFDFDFSTADRLVCTELVHYAYQGPDRLQFRLVEILGRKTLPALAILEKWARERGGEHAQLDYVCFLDSIEEQGVARKRGEEELLETLDRPGLTLLQSHGGSSTYPRAFLIVLCSLLCLGLIFLRRG